MIFRNFTRMSESKISILENLQTVKDSLACAVAKRPTTSLTLQPRLVCVSKTKPASVISTAYEVGQRHFGENYVNELVEKSHDLAEECPHVKWHFIGLLQTNKVNKLLSSRNLYMIETIHSEKIADKVNSSWVKSASNTGSPLNIMVQVNTSQEPQKSGVSPEETCHLVGHILDKCDNLHFCGLMTIGSFSHDYSTGPNPDFVTLLKCKDQVMEKFALTSDQVEVSMGMSGDFTHAVEMGSTNVRVGSTIFGARDYSKNTEASNGS